MERQGHAGVARDRVARPHLRLVQQGSRAGNQSHKRETGKARLRERRSGVRTPGPFRPLVGGWIGGGALGDLPRGSLLIQHWIQSQLPKDCSLGV